MGAGWLYGMGVEVQYPSWNLPGSERQSLKRARAHTCTHICVWGGGKHMVNGSAQTPLQP